MSESLHAKTTFHLCNPPGVSLLAGIVLNQRKSGSGISLTLFDGGMSSELMIGLMRRIMRPSVAHASKHLDHSICSKQSYHSKKRHRRFIS